ncbi:alpha/beta hydrolase [Pelagibius sp. Alg239-R121]|uniref:alpha/beta hydrolase n=1 Tax=Pelagibius sp. Alg239-R121 TaxID=2993448 RepID=UPI0024A6E1F4|nr:alpha/beta hydrolase [Pelagibius sp. Alg239-R121]
MSEVEVFLIAGRPALQLRRLRNSGPPVLYVHGATFPSALSFGYRFVDGRSWEDDLHSRGFDAWSFDFAGFGGSERMDASSTSLSDSRAKSAAEQISRVVDYIREQRDGEPVNLIAHSWGSIAAGCYLNHCAHSFGRLVFFGPIAQRQGSSTANVDALPATRLITVEAQLARFIADLPNGNPPVLEEPDLRLWGPAYLSSDPVALTRNPPSVEVPGGPAADIAAAWQGELGYDPASIKLPTLVIRGEWDSLCNDQDAGFLLRRLGSEQKCDVVIPKATHLMHLEMGRFALWEATAAFLQKQNPPAAFIDQQI